MIRADGDNAVFVEGVLGLLEGLRPSTASRANEATVGTAPRVVASSRDPALHLFCILDPRSKVKLKESRQSLGKGACEGVRGSPRHVRRTAHNHLKASGPEVTHIPVLNRTPNEHDATMSSGLRGRIMECGKGGCRETAPNPGSDRINNRYVGNCEFDRMNTGHDCPQVPMGRYVCQYSG